MITVNGSPLPDGVGPTEVLLTVMRDRLGLKGAKEGCGRGECGACTVLVDGLPVMACVTFVGAVGGDVRTIEGLAEEARDLRHAFARFGGFQCGFCTAGQIVHAQAVLGEMAQVHVDDAEAFVRHRMSGNICRCTGYNGIVDAILHVHAERTALREQAA